MTDILYVTKQGQEAERQALASGRVIKLAHVAVDSVKRAADLDLETLTSITIPNDSDGIKAKYAVHGESRNGSLLVAWTLPANSGGYTVEGLGFFLEDGTLWGYQRLGIGHKPIPSSGAFFEPKGLITHESDTASAITCNLHLDDAYATLDDVNYLLRQQRLEMLSLMRRQEGKLGKVRLFMANDVDEDYVAIRGQVLKRTDYPDYFAYMKVTASTITLPDWGDNGYVRQFNDTHEAGVVLNQSIQSHGHNGSVLEGGSHTPAAFPIDMGSRTVGFSVDSRYYTNEDRHSHDRGSMNIRGGFQADDHNNGHWGAFVDDGAGRYDFSSNGGNGRKMAFDASRNWTGRTSENVHKHYVDIKFSRHMTVSIGSYTPRMKAVPAHTHRMTIEKTGEVETRPNTTVAVYAVKVKYVTPNA